MKLNEWEESIWFKEWMELAQTSGGSGQAAVTQALDRRKGKEKGAPPPTGMDLIPPFAEWNFSVHEAAAMCVRPIVQ
jgi:hypothetical protein